MSGNLSICAIPEELKRKLKQFRFSKSKNINALILKVDRESQAIIVEEELDDCNIEELKNELPVQQPRFLLISYPMKLSDGRETYPMCLIYYSPDSCNPEIQMLYAGTRNTLVSECELTKNFELRELEDFSRDWLESYLK
uniref:ADF-H domain-containing protein n=1 Tax=Parastrongyloides trichosuri TaxID=131310 RepID=A0A0N4ZNE5_PARTI